MASESGINVLSNLKRGILEMEEVGGGEGDLRGRTHNLLKSNPQKEYVRGGGGGGVAA
jgi:hypothetical protein